MKNKGENPSDQMDEMPEYQSTVAKQFELIFRRTVKTTLRNKGALLGKLVPSIFFALVLGAVYSGTSRDQKSIQDRVGALFFFAINQTFGNVLGVQNTFGPERTVVERERASNSYRIGPFYAAKYIAELPFNLISPIFFGCVVYWIVGFNPAPDRFLSFLTLLLLTGLAAVGLGMFLASVFKNPDVARDISPIVVVLMILFGGFYVNVESLPMAIRWIQYLSLLRWGFVGLTVNEFRGLKFSCKGVKEGDACVETGNEELERLSFEDETVGGAMLALFLYGIIANSMAYLALVLRRKQYQQVEPHSAAPALRT